MSDADCCDLGALVVDSHRLLGSWGCLRKDKAGTFVTASDRRVELMARCLHAAQRCATAPLVLEVMEDRMFDMVY